MDIFLPITEVLHTLAFKFENLDIFSLPFQYVIIKDIYSIWYHIVKVAEIEKVNRNITRCNYAFDGLDFNLDDPKKNNFSFLLDRYISFMFYLRNSYSCLHDFKVLVDRFEIY